MPSHTCCVEPARALYATQEQLQRTRDFNSHLDSGLVPESSGASTGGGTGGGAARGAWLWWASLFERWPHSLVVRSSCAP